MAPTEYTDLLRTRGGQARLLWSPRGSQPPLDERAQAERDAEIEAKREELQAEIEETREKEDERLERLEEVEQVFGTHIDDLVEKIRTIRERRERNAEELDLLENPLPVEPPPPGPNCLMFILGDWFNLVATLVIVSNITTMVMEMIDKDREKQFFYLDQSYMVFYIFEIVIKVLLLRVTMVCGPIFTVWWNWLDLIIVISGCVDMYLMPILQSSGLMAAGGANLKALSFLRALRLLRILKIVGMFFKADLSFANGDAFQGFIMGVIGFNSVIMGLEIEIPAFSGWFYVEQTLLVIFTFELLCRLKNFGCAFFYGGDIIWNWLDFIIVMGGIVDQWLMPAIDLIKMLMGQPTGGKGSLGQVMMMLRMARLLRILRLVRLVKNIPPLFQLVVGIANSMQGMVWVVVLTVVILYAMSLLGVKLIGRGLLLGPDADPEVMAVFPNIFDSFFVLFKAMNGDWGSLEPLFVALPWSKVVLFLYTVLSTWGILSILTAVVSENMISTTNAVEAEEEELQQREDSERKEQELLNIFEQMDHDGNGFVCKDEYRKMLIDEDTRKRLMAASELTKHELSMLFGFLEEPHPQAAALGREDPVIHKRTFVSGLKHNSRTISERSVMQLESRIRILEAEMRGWARQTLQPILEEDERLGARGLAEKRVISGDVADFMNGEDRDEPHPDDQEPYVIKKRS